MDGIHVEQTVSQVIFLITIFIILSALFDKKLKNGKNNNENDFEMDAGRHPDLRSDVVHIVFERR